LVILGIVALEVVGLFFFHQTKVDELTEVKAEVGRLTTQINEIKAVVKDHEKIKADLDKLRAREDAIAKLQAGRAGPTAVLLELSRLLTRGKGPTVSQEQLDQQREENPLATYNPGWDTRRVWLTSYAESERYVRVEGLARDASDVSELSQRLKLSRYFEEIELLQGQESAKSVEGVELVQFALQMTVKY
jgi:type IV pilus assembly protein PilN